MPAPLRVAFDARDALAAGGWGRYARELLKALRAEAAVASLTGGGPLPEVAWEQVVLPARLRRLAPDLVHAPNCFLPLLRPCPGVVTIHDLAFEQFPEDFSPRTGAKYRFITPRAARSAERVICVSQFTRDDVCSRYGVDPARVRVVWNAPALPIGTAPARGGGAPYVLGAGDLRAKKNWRRLVEAVRALRASGLPELRLVIAGGDAGEGAALRAAAGSDWLELPGYLGDRELDALMRGAAALCHPSLYEGFGLVVVEAQARGVPVACSATTALPEAAGGAAQLFDPLDVDAIAAALCRAIGNAELGARGRERAAELSWTRAARETVAVYREAIAA